jgi:hypothetical protein
MAVPKNFKTNININPSKIGYERREEILHGIEDNGTFLPRGVSEEDMDERFISFVQDELSLTIDGNKVPVIFLTIQRWSEFTKTWQFTDKYKDITIPFVTVVRRPDIQVGQNQAGLFNIPGNYTYTYMKVPTWDGVRKGVDLYKVPQPTSVDITYEVRIFTGRMKDLNKFNSKIHRTFQSRQYYIDVKGHPMPVLLENIGDDSNIENFEERRFYVQNFEMRLMGYLLDEDDFEIVPTANRLFLAYELDDEQINRNLKAVNLTTKIDGSNKLNYTIIYKQLSNPDFSITAPYALTFTGIANFKNITNIIIKVNNIQVFSGLTITTPININANDEITFSVTKNNFTICKLELIGYIQ